MQTALEVPITRVKDEFDSELCRMWSSVGTFYKRPIGMSDGRSVDNQMDDLQSLASKESRLVHKKNSLILQHKAIVR